MDFAHHDLGHRSSGEIVEVTLSGSPANVRLMDSSNLTKYRAGKDHTCYGGLVKRSPFHIKIPRSGHWHVAVDLLGLRGGRTRSSVRVLPKPLPVAKEAPLSSVPSLVQGGRGGGIAVIDEVAREYDVFISHASEDKDAVVRPLARALQSAGLAVWYDEFELRIGDSLRRKIDRGLANSRFGIVVLSQDFLKKGWPNYELDGIITRVNSGDQVLLPIWHNISKEAVVEFSPSLADKLGRNTATHTVVEIAAEIAAVIRGDR